MISTNHKLFAVANDLALVVEYHKEGQIVPLADLVVIRVVRRSYLYSTWRNTVD